MNTEQEEVLMEMDDTETLVSCNVHNIAENRSNLLLNVRMELSPNI